MMLFKSSVVWSTTLVCAASLLPACQLDGDSEATGAAAQALGAQPGDLIDVAIGDLHPTQSVLGYYEIYYKLGRYRSDKDELGGSFNKRFDDWCETNGQGEAATVDPGARLDTPSSFTCTIAVGAETPDSLAQMKTVVIGPFGQLYVSDGHHTFTSFLETPDGGPNMHIRVRVAGNLSDLSPSDFWAQMQANHWVWLWDENNQPITVADLPDRLGLASFHHDPYRSLVYFTKDIGYAVPADAPEFLEFVWGMWLRPVINLAGYGVTDPTTYLSLVKSASQSMAALKTTDIVAQGMTAGQLGKMATWNDGKAATKGEFAKLSKPITDAKPGKVAYAFDFLADVSQPPACTTTITGFHAGPISVKSGVTCIDRATVVGPVKVSKGASLVMMGARVVGPIFANGAQSVHLCGNIAVGPIMINGTVGDLFLGGTGCTPNNVVGPVMLTQNQGAVVVDGNHITGPLACDANVQAPVGAGRPNQVEGPEAGQCAGL